LFLGWSCFDHRQKLLCFCKEGLTFLVVVSDETIQDVCVEFGASARGLEKSFWKFHGSLIKAHAFFESQFIFVDFCGCLFQGCLCVGFT